MYLSGRYAQPELEFARRGQILDIHCLMNSCPAAPSHWFDLKEDECICVFHQTRVSFYLLL